MEKKGICIIGKKGSSEEGRIGFHAWCVAAIAVAVLLVAGITFLILRGKESQD